MLKCRENLIDRVNQQESLKFQVLENERVENPQRLARCETRDTKYCPKCGKSCKNGYSWCEECYRIGQRARYSGFSFKLVQQLSTIQACECCGCRFTKENKQCIHHLGVLRGVVCNRCNQILGDESEQRRTQLLACVLWIKESMIQSDLYENV